MPPTTRPTLAQIQAALSNLGDGWAGLGEALLAAPGLTADAVLIYARGLDAGARERRTLFPGGDEVSDGMAALARILTDAAPRFADSPPREPATLAAAREADAAIRRSAAAAGLCTAGSAYRSPGGLAALTVGGGEI